MLEAEVEKEGGDKGKATLTVAGIHFELGIALGRSPTNHLTLTKTACYLNITTLDVTTDGN